MAVALSLQQNCNFKTLPAGNSDQAKREPRTTSTSLSISIM